MRKFHDIRAAGPFQTASAACAVPARFRRTASAARRAGAVRQQVQRRVEPASAEGRGGGMPIEEAPVEAQDAIGDLPLTVVIYIRGVRTQSAGLSQEEAAQDPDRVADIEPAIAVHVAAEERRLTAEADLPIG